jgi:hypothetical protein
VKLHIDSRGKLTEEETFQGILSKYLSSPQGRAQFAAAMAAPIRRSLDYHNIARKALVVDPMPQGALPCYDRDIDVSAVVTNDDKPVAFSHDFLTINARGKLEKRSPFGKRVVVPTFEVFQNPTIKISEVKRRRFDLIDRAVQKARQEILAQEDEDIFKQIDAAGSDIVSKDSGNNTE